MSDEYKTAVSVSGNVYSISGERIVPAGQPIENVVQSLEEMLALAKSGVLRQVIICGVESDGSTRSAWHGQYRDLVGCAAFIKSRLLQLWHAD